jgi:hypothetical protein
MSAVPLQLMSLHVVFTYYWKAIIDKTKETPNSIIKEQLSRLCQEINQAIDLMITLLPEAYTKEDNDSLEMLFDEFCVQFGLLK